MNNKILAASLLLAASSVLADNQQNHQKSPITVPDTTERYIVMFDDKTSLSHQQGPKGIDQLSVFNKQGFPVRTA